jgi:hypothetical protein
MPQRVESSAERICLSSVWICKEDAFSLVSRVVLLYILIGRKKKIWRYLLSDDSKLNQ